MTQPEDEYSKDERADSAAPASTDSGDALSETEVPPPMPASLTAAPGQSMPFAGPDLSRITEEPVTPGSEATSTMPEPEPSAPEPELSAAEPDAPAAHSEPGATQSPESWSREPPPAAKEPEDLTETTLTSTPWQPIPTGPATSAVPAYQAPAAPPALGYQAPTSPAQQWQQPAAPPQGWQQPAPQQPGQWQPGGQQAGQWQQPTGQWQQPPPQHWQQPAPPYPGQPAGPYRGQPTGPYPGPPAPYFGQPAPYFGQPGVYPAYAQYPQSGPAYSTSLLATVAGMVLLVFGLIDAVGGFWLYNQTTELRELVQDLVRRNFSIFGSPVERSTLVSILSPLPPFLMIFGAIQVLAAIGIFAHKSWGRALGVLIGLLALIVSLAALSFALALAPGASAQVIGALVVMLGYAFILLALIAGGKHFRRRYPQR